MASLTSSSSVGLEKLKGRRPFDWWLLLSSVLLLTFGLMSLRSLDLTGHTSFFPKQLLRVVVGLVPFFIFLLVNPKFWFRYSKVLYIFNVLLLGVVLFMGRDAKGATRWINIGPFDFQPSELAKLLVVITLAAFLVSRADSIRSLPTFLLSLAHVLLPALLIFKQPHLGSTLAIMVAWLAMTLVAGTPFRDPASIVVLGIALLALGVIPLHGYQENRITGLFNGKDNSSGFQSARAEMAYAAGGISGMGYGQGEQKIGVPESENDFISVVVGEEGGLIGCTLMLATFGLFFYRVWLAMFLSEDMYYRLVAGGLMSILAFHTIINLAMNLKLFPVVGLWLPFLSYGGTAMWLCMACVGLLLNIRSREAPVLFA